MRTISSTEGTFGQGAAAATEHDTVGGVGTRRPPVSTRDSAITRLLSCDGGGGETVDMGGFDSAVFYFDGALAREPLCDAVQYAGVDARHFSFRPGYRAS